MIKELIFSGKKFWQSESEPLIGKRIKAPSKPILVYNEFHTFGCVDGKFVSGGIKLLYRLCSKAYRTFRRAVIL